MTEFLASLEASSFSTWLRESPSIWAYPTVLTLHTVGLGVLVGANWMLDLRVLGFARALPTSLFARAFPIMWSGFWLNAATGVLLFVADPKKATTTIFMWKLAIIAVAVMMLITLKRKLYGEPGDLDNVTGPVKAVAAVSIVLWVAAIATGRWMAYVV
ncbi:MAG TPA: DUF6644 family protein [Vicinamibacterales bacterium]|nr:DUF6644 family protein [Vicinamibacterales bacterium]